MPNFKPPPQYLLLLLLQLSLTTTNATKTNTNNNMIQKFKEAPKFYNSPTCPPLNMISTTSTTTITIDKNMSCTPQESSTAAVHVAMTLDYPYLRGTMAAILSILQHSSCPENIFFHFITTETETENNHLHAAITASFPYLNSRLYTIETTSVSGLMSTSIRSALDTTLNYARNYLATLLPHCITRVTYLDSDLVLVDDIINLASTPLPDDIVLAAPEYCNANFTSYFTPTFWSNPSLSITFETRKRTPCYFNTGVMVIDLVKWREGDYTKVIVEWMELQKRIRIYELGSLPPFLLVFGGNIASVDHRWNQHGLGGDNYKGLCRDLHPGPVSLLHWSGKGKPWVRLDSGKACPLDTLWAPYDLLLTPPLHLALDS